MNLTDIKNKYADVELEVSYSYGKDGDKEYGIIVLDKIVVPKEKRNLGIGTEIITLLCNYTDEVKSVLMLSPSDSLGATSVNRLKKFYKRFGLICNSGKTKIYSFPNYSMYRFPK